MNSESKPSSSARAANRRIWSPCRSSSPGKRYEGRKTPSFKWQLLGGESAKDLARAPIVSSWATRMPETIRLPDAGGRVYYYAPKGKFLYAESGAPPRSRLPYAAVHVVANALADSTPSGPAAIDWDRPLAYRRHIWSYGLGVAEAMDTAQRG